MIDIESVKNFPEAPGVYIFKSGDEFLYIGKAKNIKRRLMQHFSGKNEKSSLIIQEADRVEFIQTKTEREALILEANLIYTHKPKYNVLLKGTEVYPYIRISEGVFPYVEVVRRKRGRGEFHGPFTNVGFVKSIIEILQEIYRFRTCKKDLKRVKRPCMEYHLGRCMGPCTGDLDVWEYEKALDGLRKFLKGDITNAVEYIKRKMKHHSEMLDFENAARYRDLLAKMEVILQKQGVALEDSRNLDVVVGESDLFVVLRIRGGLLMGKLVYEMRGGTLKDFLEHFYAKEADLPERIVTSDWTGEILNVRVEKPRDDVERHVLEMALENLKNEICAMGIRREQLRRLAEFAGLKDIPHRIEGIDVSHLMGRGTVASVVVFIDGKPEKSEYRRYRLNLKRPDDYLAIKEVVVRRYSKHDVPDLLLVDGGIGQLKAALHGLKRVGKRTTVLGIAKSDERIVMETGEYRLPHDSPVVRALVSIRDEAHRFALSGNRKIRERENLKSLLDSVKGIGPVRKRKILERYRTLEELREASLEELTELLGSTSVAERLLKLV